MVPNADAEAPQVPPRLAPMGPDHITAELDRVAARALRQISAENFPVALRVLPREPRGDLVRAYAFARFVDDIGDESQGDRLDLLDAVDQDLRRLPAGRSVLAPVQGLARLVGRHGLSIDPLLDLVEANRRDQLVTRYETFDDLLGYCRLSAAPIGRIVLAVAGISDAVAVERSDRVCAALQVLEHCQDVGEDWAMGRIYLPMADLRAAGVAEDDLGTRCTPDALRRVIAQQLERTAHLLADGRPLVRQLHGWARLAVVGYVAGGRATAAALRRG
ncbi:MAG: hypothetical protein QOG80_777, partial [Pseudonocardiales bacterium]|nr:hypothetical protein [Pseudonocardiales bacterium]